MTNNGKSTRTEPYKRQLRRWRGNCESESNAHKNNSRLPSKPDDEIREAVAPERVSWMPPLVRRSAFGLGLFLVQVAQRSQPVPRVAGTHQCGCQFVSLTNRCALGPQIPRRSLSWSQELCRQLLPAR